VALRAEPYASPITAPDLAGLPPALILTAEFDPLRDEAEAYGEQLATAGVPTTVQRWDGLIHGFFGMAGLFDEAQRAFDETARAMAEALA
jgi:acetyl esterase